MVKVSTNDETSGGARFREMTSSDFQETSELERLCDLGAAEVLMPKEEFQASVNGDWSIASVERLIEGIWKFPRSNGISIGFRLSPASQLLVYFVSAGPKEIKLS